MKINKFERIGELLSKKEFTDKIESCVSEKTDSQFLGNFKEEAIYFGKKVLVEKPDIKSLIELFGKNHFISKEPPGEEEKEYSRTYAKKRVDALIYSFNLEKMHKDSLVFLVDFNFDNSNTKMIDEIDRRISKKMGISGRVFPSLSAGMGAGSYILLDKFNKLYHPNFIFVKLYAMRNTSLVYVSAVDQQVKELGSETAFRLAFIKGMESIRPDIFSKGTSLGNILKTYNKYYQKASGIMDLENRTLLFNYEKPEHQILGDSV